MNSLFLILLFHKPVHLAVFPAPYPAIGREVQGAFRDLG